LPEHRHCRTRLDGGTYIRFARNMDARTQSNQYGRRASLMPVAMPNVEHIDVALSKVAMKQRAQTFTMVNVVAVDGTALAAGSMSGAIAIDPHRYRGGRPRC
jgi:hypothetical protein